MVIVFANQKGGVGKTTLAISYANHLAESGKPVIFVDADIQRSSWYKRESEKSNWSPESLKYKIEAVTLKEADESRKLMETAHNASKQGVTVIIDVPGNITEDYLGPLFIYADVIICPFIFESMALHSTSTFIKVLSLLQKQYKDMNPKKFFVPNMVTYKLGNAEELVDFQRTEQVFSEFGYVTPRVYLRAEMKRITTVMLTNKQKKEVNDCFSFIDSHLF